MTQISYRTLTLISTQINGLLNDCIADVNEAFARVERQLDISIKVSLSPDSKGIKVKTSMSFVATRITDEITTVFDENQIDFDFSEHEELPAKTIGPPSPPEESEEALIKKIKIE